MTHEEDVNTLDRMLYLYLLAVILDEMSKEFSEYYVGPGTQMRRMAENIARKLVEEYDGVVT